MSNTNTNLEEQTGGWFSVNIISVDDLEYCPSFLTNTNAFSIKISLTDDDLNILPVGEKINITAPPQKSTSGILYNIKADIEFKNQSKKIDTYLNKYLNQKVVLIGVKHFGQQVIYGSKQYPLDFYYQNINGKNYEDGSSIKVVISGKIPQKPVFIND
ncbi:hypothetical protein [Algibacter sp. PT7-4]|uniref:hypothetical protein n=1 Tax=Algibacter ulvanivorans TaxID=3400999 RepID=UPI003AAF1BF1